MKRVCVVLLTMYQFQGFSQNVGIGTGSPLSKLHVAGTIRSDTLIGAGVRSLFAAPNGRIYDSLVIPSTINWQINGNSNIAAANFLGTTNAVDVIFKTNSAERARILATGNFGIGTPAPSMPLTVIGNTASDMVRIQNNNNAGYSTIQFFDNANTFQAFMGYGNTGVGAPLSGNTYWGTLPASTADFVFNPKNVERMRFTNPGNLGIGIASPLARLHVHNDFGLNGTEDPILILEQNGVNVNNGSSIQFRNDGAGFYSAIAGLDDAGADGRIEFRTNDDGIITTSPLTSADTRMTIVQNGNVGIGTMTPANRLQITSATANTSGLRFTNLTSASPTVAAVAGKALSVDVNGDVILVPSLGNAWSLTGNAGTTPAVNFLGTTDPQDLVFRTNNTEKARILSSGNFGIGTSTPGQMLHVNGNALANEFWIFSGAGDLKIHNAGTANTMVFNTSGLERMRITNNGNVGIGTNAPNASALLEIASTTQGVKFPSLTSAQRAAIAAPPVGLMVYDVTANILMSYNGTRWQEVGGDPIGSIEAFHKNMVATPTLPWGWVECNGQVLADPESPYNGQTMPLLNANGKFLRGSTVSGTMQTEDVGTHTHAGTTSADGSHNHTGSTGSVNSTNGRVVPWDDNLTTDKMDGTDTGQLINTPPGGGGLPWDGLATVGNFITTIDQLDHTHAISTDGVHTHTFTTSANTGTETRPTNMSVVWIIRVK